MRDDSQHQQAANRCRKTHIFAETPSLGMYAQTADFSVMRNFPVYDAWDGLICARPAVSWPRFPAKLSVFMAIYGKFEREISGNGPPGIFGALGVDPQYKVR